MIYDLRTIFGRAVVICVFLALCSSCNSDRKIEARNLVKSAAGYNGKIITVSGCYSKGYESTILHSCDKPKSDEAIWLVPYTQIENTAKAFPGYGAQFRPLERRPSSGEAQLAAKLVQMEVGRSVRATMRGEFRFSAAPQYGHDSSYKYELIVHRVLSLSPRDSQ